MRGYSQRVYGIPPEQVVGTALGTKTGDGARLSMICCTTTRNANTPMALRVGCLTPRSEPQALYDEAMKGWLVISIKDDWNCIFAFE